MRLEDVDGAPWRSPGDRGAPARAKARVCLRGARHGRRRVGVEREPVHADRRGGDDRPLPARRHGEARARPDDRPRRVLPDGRAAARRLRGRPDRAGRAPRARVPRTHQRDRRHEDRRARPRRAVRRGADGDLRSAPHACSPRGREARARAFRRRPRRGRGARDPRSVARAARRSSSPARSRATRTASRRRRCARSASSAMHDRSRSTRRRAWSASGWVAFEGLLQESVRRAERPSVATLSGAVWHEPLSLELAREREPLVKLLGAALSAAAIPTSPGDWGVAARTLVAPRAVARRRW